MHYWNKLNQFWLWVLAKLYLFITFSNHNIYLQANSINKDNGYVVASDHHSNLDPFVVLGSMPLRILIKLSPVRTMTHRNLFVHWPVRWFLLSLGAYPNKEVANLSYGLEYSEKILSSHGTIAIFPEGTRVKLNEKVDAKHGVAVLASIKDSQVIMCRLNWGKNRKLKVTISEPQTMDGKSAQNILDQIYALD